MKVGILIICIGKYSVFFESLLESCEANFLPNFRKNYYVFTDAGLKAPDNVKVVYQSNLGWPYNTLRRFQMFNRVADILESEDFLFFLNANMIVNNKVSEEILPGQENNFLMGVNHPGFYNKPRELFTYERQPRSAFQIPTDRGRYYFQGCFNGGRSAEFLKMSMILDCLIDLDLSNGIMPIWHDESALNWYYLNRNPLVVNPSYAYPEGWNLPFDAKIIQRDKNKFGGYNFLRD